MSLCCICIWYCIQQYGVWVALLCWQIISVNNHEGLSVTYHNISKGFYVKTEEWFSHCPTFETSENWNDFFWWVNSSAPKDKFEYNMVCVHSTFRICGENVFVFKGEGCIPSRRRFSMEWSLYCRIIVRTKCEFVRANIQVGGLWVKRFAIEETWSNTDWFIWISY